MTSQASSVMLSPMLSCCNLLLITSALKRAIAAMDDKLVLNMYSRTSLEEGSVSML